MLRIAVQSKGRLFEDTMDLLKETGIKVSSSKRTLLVQASNFPLEVLFLRDDDIPQTVADGVADVGIVGENEFVERNENADIVKRLGFSKCRISLAIPKAIDYPGVEWFNGKKIATSYPVILKKFMDEKGVKTDIHVIQGSVEIAPGIGLADGIFDIVSSGSTLVSNNLKDAWCFAYTPDLVVGVWFGNKDGKASIYKIENNNTLNSMAPVLSSSDSSVWIFSRFGESESIPIVHNDTPPHAYPVPWKEGPLCFAPLPLGKKFIEIRTRRGDLISQEKYEGTSFCLQENQVKSMMAPGLYRFRVGNKGRTTSFIVIY